jgi:hypothetical protein
MMGAVAIGETGFAEFASNVPVEEQPILAPLKTSISRHVWFAKNVF